MLVEEKEKQPKQERPVPMKQSSLVALDELLDADPTDVLGRAKKMQELLEKRLEAIDKKKQKARLAKNTRKGLVWPKTATFR